MAREFAKAFYHSSSWKLARDAYVSERRAIDGGMCEWCHEELGEEVHHKTWLRPDNIDDPDVTLNPDNFAFLCGNCHKAEHRTARVAALRTSAGRSENPTERNGYFIDEAGNLRPLDPA